MKTIIAIEKISSYLRRWLDLPRIPSSIALYGSTNTLQLPFKGQTEEYMVTKTREMIATAGIEVRTGRRWNSSRELEIVEERLRYKALVGTVAVGRSGLGYSTNKDIRRATSEEYRHLLQKEVRAGGDELRFGKMVALDQQGAWARWDGILKRKISWLDICGSNFVQIRFLIQAVYYWLPSPANLHTWGRVETPQCPLCEKASWSDAKGNYGGIWQMPSNQDLQACQ